MDNTPNIYEAKTVREYLGKFGLDFWVNSVEEVENPNDDMMSFKFNSVLKGNNKTLRSSLYGTYSQWIRHDGKSAWEIINNIFRFAQLSYIYTHKSFCQMLSMTPDESTRKIYNKSKRSWKRLLELGLNQADIAEIVSYSMNKQLVK